MVDFDRGCPIPFGGDSDHFGGNTPRIVGRVLLRSWVNITFVCLPQLRRLPCASVRLERLGLDHVAQLVKPKKRRKTCPVRRWKSTSIAKRCVPFGLASGGVCLIKCSSTPYLDLFASPKIQVGASVSTEMTPWKRKEAIANVCRRRPI